MTDGSVVVPDADDDNHQEPGAWPNEPAGFTPIVDCPFSGNVCNLDNYYHTADFATDPTAPGSGPTVFDEFMAVGSAQGNGEWGINLNHPRELYVGTWWSTNADFVGYSNNQNKLLFARNYRDNNFLGWQGFPGQPKQIKWYMQATYDNCGHPGEYGMCYSQGDGTGWFEPNHASGTVAAGSGWHRLEFYLKTSTTTSSRDGIVRWWVDGELVGDYPTVNLTPDGFEDFVITAAWDGAIPCPTVRDCSKAWHHYWDDLRISVPAN